MPPKRRRDDVRRQLDPPTSYEVEKLVEFRERVLKTWNPATGKQKIVLEQTHTFPVAHQRGECACLLQECTECCIGVSGAWPAPSRSPDDSTRRMHSALRSWMNRQQLEWGHVPRMLVQWQRPRTFSGLFFLWDSQTPLGAMEDRHTSTR